MGRLAVKKVPSTDIEYDTYGRELCNGCIFSDPELDHLDCTIEDILDCGPGYIWVREEV